MTKIKLHGDFMLTSDVMSILNDIMYSKDPVLEAGNLKRDIVHQKYNIGDKEEWSQYSIALTA